MRTRAWTLALVIVTGLPTAHALFHERPPSPLPGNNGMDTVFGTINATVKAPYEGRPVDVEATVVLRNDPALERARIYMFAFVVPTDAARVELVGFSDAQGRPIPVDKDERAPGERDQKVFVAARNVTLGKPLHLEGRAWLLENGRMPVGSLVIAFDEQWKKLETSDGRIAQLYAYTFVGAQDLPARSGPPFQGQGRVLPGDSLASLLILVAAGYGLLLYRVTLSRSSW